MADQHTDNHLPMGDSGSTQWVFVFDDLPDWQTLAAAAPEGAQVVVLDGTQDGLAQIAAHLQGRTGVDAIHILSHGQPGSLQLGAFTLDQAALAARADTLARIGGALGDGGDILLYGCDVAANGAGEAFVRALAEATDADVAASQGLTGSAGKGGDWALEFHQGRVDTASLSGLAAYAGLLAAPTTQSFDGVTLGDVGGTMSFGTPGAPRTIDNWTFTLLNAAGTQDLSPNAYVDVTNDAALTSLANDGGDKAAYLNGNYVAGTGNAAAVLKAASGEEFSFVSVRVETGGSAGSDYRLVGYLNGSPTGATQNFTSGAFGSGGTLVTVSGTAWQYVDEIRIVRQSGDTDISIYIDDLVIASAVPPNVAPVATASGGTTAFTEGANVASTPVVVDSGITVTDSDSSTLASATVSITGNFQNGADVLAFTNNPATMGNISAVYTAGTGVLALTSAGATATLAQWQAALRSVTYTNSSDAPSTSNRTISFVTNDGTASSTATNKTVSVTSANDVPVDTTSGGSTAFTEGNNTTSPPVAVDGSFTVTDGDNATLASATVAITGNFQNGEDELAFTNNPGTMGNISASYNAATGVMTLTSAGATATLAQWQAALRSVTYTNSSDTPNTSNRTVSFTTNDGTADGNTATKTVTVSSTNDSAIATASGGTTAFTEGANVASTPVVVDSGVTLSDVDSATLASATVSITGNLQAAEDLLAFTNNPATMGNISASYNAGSGVMTLTSAGATATLAQWQAALRSVTYTNSSDNPNTGNRTISFVANDGSTNSTATTKTVSVTAGNDTPVDTASGGSTAFTQGNPTSTPVAVDSGFTVTDPDNATLASATVAITGNFQNGEDELAFTNNPGTMGNINASYNAATGVLTLTSAGATATVAQWQAALRSVTYTDTAGTVNTSTRTISITTNDGTADGNTVTKAVTVAAFLFPPVSTTSGGTTAFTEGANTTSTPVVVDSALTLSDVDSATLASATVSITGNFQTGEDLLAFTNNPATMGNISASYNAATGVMTLTSAGATATTAQWQAALRSVTYTNSSDTPNTSNRTISFAANDGNSSGTAATKVVSVTAANDVPVDTTSGGSTAFTEGNNTASTPVAVDGSFTVTDGDNATLASATVAITGNLQTAEDELAFTNNPGTMGNISAVYVAGTGVMTLTSAGATATVAQWQAALRSITYTNSSDTPNTGNRTVSFTTNDGTADGNTATKTVTVSSTNDSAIATASGGTTAFTEGANVASTPVVVDSGVTLSDLDSATLASATVSITGNLQTAEDLLAFTNVAGTMGNISAVYAAGTGVMTLTSAGATATVAQWQAALRAVTYSNSSDTPNTGNRTISFVVNDGSSNSTATTKTVSVAATNDAPVNTIPAAQTMLTGATHLFNSAGGSLISIGDGDAGASTVKVTLTATQGLLTLSGIAGLAFTTGDGTGDASMVFTGTVADINTALNGMAFAPTAGFAGAASIEITSDDQGFAGSGGVKTDTDTVAITVNASGSGGSTPPSTTVDGTPVTTEPGPGGSTIVTIPVVVPTRPDTPGTPSALADIPIVKAPDGHPILQVSVPTGVGLQAEGLSTTTTGSAALAELGFRIERIAGNNPELTNAGQVFFASMPPNEPLSVQILKPTIGAGYDGSQPLVISGSSNPADGKQAVIVDARALPSGTVIQVDNIEFIAVVGAVRITGGVGQNAASGDGAAQWIVLGPDDDTIHGGGGNDTVGSEGGDDQVHGDAGDDTVFGGAGNDLLSGGTGSDHLNGGTGFDVAIQEGKRTDYSVTLDGAGIRITHTASGVFDWLVDVEQLRFETGPSLTVAHSAAEEAAAYLFQKWIGRELTQSEGAIIQTLTGKTALEVATLFAQVFPQQATGKTPEQLLEGMAGAGAIRVDAIRDVTVTGDAGNNSINPTLGLARYVDGGAGIDTVVIPATLAQTHLNANPTGFTLQRMTDGAMLDLTHVERINLSDTKLALDLNGHAGEAARLLGALAGPGILSNKGVVGEVIRMLDAGASSQTVAGLGLQLLGVNTPTQIAQTLWTNVVGRAGTASELKLLTDMMASGTSAADLVVMAAHLDLTAARIDLVGLAAKGIEFA